MGAAGDSIRATASAAATLFRSPIFLAAVAGLVPLITAGWVQAVAVAKWMETIAPRATVEALERRVLALEKADDNGLRIDFDERVDLAQVLRELAADSVRSVQRRAVDREPAAARARAHFDRLTLRGLPLSTALRTVLTQEGAPLPKGLAEQGEP
jgi:hypothetical protein